MRIVRDGKGGGRGRLTSQRMLLARSHKSHKCLVCVVFFFSFLSCVMFVFKDPTWSSSLPSSRSRVLLRIQISFSVKAISGGEREGREGTMRTQRDLSQDSLHVRFLSPPFLPFLAPAPPKVKVAFSFNTAMYAESAQPLQAIAPWLGRLTVFPAFLPAFVHRMCVLSILRGNGLLLIFAPWLMTLFFSIFYGGDSGETFF